MVQAMSEDPTGFPRLGLRVPVHCCPSSTLHLPFSIQERDLLFGFHNLLHYYFITFQMTGNRIDFVSLLAWRTWSAFIIESDFIWFHFFCVYGEEDGSSCMALSSGGMS